MPRTVSFPPPSATRCPICATEIDQPECPRCGASFASADGQTLWKVDHDLFDLCRIRNDVVRRLLAGAALRSSDVSFAGEQPPVGRTGPQVVLPTDGSPETSGTSEEPAPATGVGDADPAWARPSAAAARPETDRLDALVAPGPRPARSAAPTAPRTDTPPLTPSPAAPGLLRSDRAAAPVGPRSRPPAAPTGAGLDDATPAAGAPTGPSGPHGPHGPVDRGRPARPSRRSPSVAEVLVGLGALSLVAAVVVFAAVTWSDLAAWAQGGLIVGATALVGTLMAACRRRGLVATAESLGAVAVTLALADVHVVRVGLDAVTRPTWAVGLAAVAGAGIVVGRRVRVRTPVLAGCALAFVPVPLLLAPWGPTAVAAGCAAQALAAALLARRPLPPSSASTSAPTSAGDDARSTGDPAGPDRRPFPAGVERMVVVAGALTSWLAAAGTAAVVALTQLFAVPTEAPVGPDLVLAALAAGSLLVARRGPAADGDSLGPVLAGAGTLLAFVPLPLVVVATGSGSLVTAVVVAQALAGLALLVGARLTTAEAPAVAGATITSWVAGASGAVLVGLSGLAVDGDLPTVGAGLLTALALGSVALARLAVVPPSGSDPTVDTQPGPGLAGLTALAGRAGTALLFVPALLLAAAGDLSTLSAVATAEGLVALAVTLLVGDRLLRPDEADVVGLLGPVVGAVGLGGALLAGMDAVALDAVDARVVPVATLAVAATALVAVGREARRRDLVAIGAALAFAPTVLAVAGMGSTAVLAWALVVQAAVAALVEAVVVGPPRGVVRAGGVASWAAAGTAATVMGVAGWLATPTDGPAGAIAVLAALVVVAVVAALRAGSDRDRAGTALSAAVLPVLVAAALAAGGLGADGRVMAVVGAAAVVGALSAALRRVDDRPWLTPLATAAAAGAVLAVAPLVRALDVLALLLDRVAEARDVGADHTVADWLTPALVRTDVEALPGWATLGQLAALGVLAAAVATWQRRAGGAAACAVGLATLVVAPVVVGLTVAQAVVGLGVVVVAGAEALRRWPRSPEALVGTAAAAALGTGLALAAAPLAVGWTVLVGALVVGLAALQVRVGAREAPVWAFVAAVVVVGAVALDATVLAASPDATGIAVAVAAAALAGGAWATARQPGPGRAAASAVDAVVLVASLLAAAGVRSVDALSVVVALVAGAAAVTSLRADRRPMAVVAAGLGVVLTWLQLGAADVTLVEAYTLPVAAWALGVGLVVGRGRGSWERFGAGLVLALGPTALLAVVDPSPVRTVVVVLAGAALVVAGALGRLQAPVAVGGAALVAVALRHLGPVAVEVPRSIALAVAGLVLLAVGATFEQRRQDLRQARETFSRLS